MCENSTEEHPFGANCDLSNRSCNSLAPEMKRGSAGQTESISCCDDNGFRRLGPAEIRRSYE
jgi:hypothetical protein